MELIISFEGLNGLDSKELLKFSRKIISEFWKNGRQFNAFEGGQILSVEGVSRIGARSYYEPDESKRPQARFIVLYRDWIHSGSEPMFRSKIIISRGDCGEVWETIDFDNLPNGAEVIK